MLRVEKLIKRDLILFFIIETSKGISESVMRSVNCELSLFLQTLKCKYCDSFDANIQVAVLGFDSDAYWVMKEPYDLDKFFWGDLMVNGFENGEISDAFSKLNEKLSKNGFMSGASGSLAPILFLIANAKTAANPYKAELELLKSNKWFKAARKIAFAIGDDANKDVLAEFTGKPEAVREKLTSDFLLDIFRAANQSAAPTPQVVQDNKTMPADKGHRWLPHVASNRSAQVVFFVIDTSKSMSGIRIEMVNNAIAEALPKIREMSDGNADGEIEIAVLGFDKEAYWITSEPEDVCSFVWSDLTADDSELESTNLADALRKLNEKLTRKEGGFMTTVAGSFAPVLFLMSDGRPNDSSWERELKKLEENKWYKVATKIAFAVGSDADKDVLSRLTGTTETVLEVYTPEVISSVLARLLYMDDMPLTS